jgi:hypothetical protein
MRFGAHKCDIKSSTLVKFLRGSSPAIPPKHRGGLGPKSFILVWVFLEIAE